MIRLVKNEYTKIGHFKLNLPFKNYFRIFTTMEKLVYVKLDKSRKTYYVATIFEIKQSKIDSYCRFGRIDKFDNSNNKH